MKHNKIRLLAALGAAWLVSAGGAYAQSIGFNYVSSGDHVNNGDTDSLGATELAGAPGFAQTNWNNLGRWGNNASAVIDSFGATTPLVLNWDAVTIGSSGAAGLGTSDGKLMDGMVETDWGGGPSPALTANSVYGASANQKPLIFVGGLQAWLTAHNAVSYSVVLYVAGYHNNGGTSEHWIQAASGNPFNNSLVAGADVSSHLFSTDTGVFNGTYVQVSPGATSVANRSVGGNYEVFNSLTNDEILIRSSEPNGDYQTLNVEGFQIVPLLASAPPTATTPVITPSATVYAGSPVTLTEIASGVGSLTYQWQTDGGSGGAITNIPGATAASLPATPPDTGSQYFINYDVIVHNTGGSVTSSVAILTVNPASAPIITQDTTPANIFAFVGGKVTFSAALDGTQPLTNQWQANTGSGFTNYGAASTVTKNLVLTNLQLSAAGTYRLAGTNAVGNVTTTPATLTMLPVPSAPSAGASYAYSVYTNNPLAYWRLSETNDPTTGIFPAYDSSGHHFDGTYGSAVLVNVPGPQAPTFPNFETTNVGAEFPGGVANGVISVPALNLNTNTVTLTAWIYPTGTEQSGGGLVFNRDGNNSSGLGFGNAVDGNQSRALGYNWNDNSSAYNFSSQLYPPLNQWSFVALTVTPTNATLYLYYVGSGVTNLFKAVNVASHAPAAFSGGVTWIGGDQNNVNRTFLGSMDEVAVYGRTLSEVQLQQQFLNALGGGSVPPAIITSPVSVSTFAGQTFKLSVVASGYPTPTYQWKSGAVGSGIYTNVPNTGNKSGANTNTLTISNSTLADALDYVAVAVNQSGSATSSPATITLAPVPSNGQWTVNYSVVNNNNGNPNIPFVGSGILGNGTYWNGLPGYPAASSASTLLDNGTTASGITLTFGNPSGEWFSGVPYNSLLLDPYVSCSLTSASTVTFANVPNGTYNLALYGIDGAYADRAVTFTVNGVNQSLVNVQDKIYAPGDNTALFTNVVVTGGQLVVGLVPIDSPQHSGNNEGEFNGAQLQLITGTAAGNPATISGAAVSGSNIVIKGASPDAGQTYHILSSTNLMTPVMNWIPVSSGTFVGVGFTNTIPVSSTQPQSFYRVVEP